MVSSLLEYTYVFALFILIIITKFKNVTILIN